MGNSKIGQVIAYCKWAMVLIIFFRCVQRRWHPPVIWSGHRQLRQNASRKRRCCSLEARTQSHTCAHVDASSRGLRDSNNTCAHILERFPLFFHLGFGVRMQMISDLVAWLMSIVGWNWEICGESSKDAIFTWDCPLPHIVSTYGANFKNALLRPF